VQLCVYILQKYIVYCSQVVIFCNGIIKSSFYRILLSQWLVKEVIQ